MDRELDKLFYDRKMMMGRHKLYNYLRETKPELVDMGISQRYVQRYLLRQEGYAVHVPVRNQKNVQHIITKRPLARIQFDLVDMHNREYDGYNWIMTAQDNFSKYGWAVPLKNKSTPEILRGFKEVLDSLEPHKPASVQTDNGSEFINHQVRNYFKNLGIQQIFSLPHTPQSQGQVERFNYTLKRMMSIDREANNNVDWPETLHILVSNYNHTWQETIDANPTDVMRYWLDHGGDNGYIKEILQKISTRKFGRDNDPALLQGQNAAAKMKFKVGDWVRIRLDRQRNWSRKAASHQWSSKPYVVMQAEEKTSGPYKTARYRVFDARSKEEVPYYFYNDTITLYYPPSKEAARNDDNRATIQRILRPQVYWRKKTRDPANPGQYLPEIYEPGYMVKHVGFPPEVTQRSLLMEDVPALVKRFDTDHNVKWWKEGEIWHFSWDKVGRKKRADAYRKTGQFQQAEEAEED